MKIQSVLQMRLWAMTASAVAMATLSQPASAAQLAENGSKIFVFGQSEYFLTNGVKSWQDAQAEATGLANPGHLVAINDASEQQFLVNTFDSSLLYWIGLTDSATEGSFGWVNGDPLSYTNWSLLPDGSGPEPNNLNIAPGGVGEDYVLMNWLAPGTWADFPSPGSLSGPANYAGIIERPVAVPTPALLPGLLAFGAGVIRKRKAAAA